MARLITPRELLDRRRFGRGRADDLARLRARFAVAEGGSRAGALRVLEHKRAVLAAMGTVDACAGCDGARPGFAGGRCCGTTTLEVFRPEEVRVLKAAGRGAPSRAARDPEAGCAFRAATGCVLPVDDRPVRCVQYVCEELRAELENAGRWETIQEARRALANAFADYQR